MLIEKIKFKNGIYSIIPCLLQKLFNTVLYDIYVEKDKQKNNLFGCTAQLVGTILVPRPGIETWPLSSERSESCGLPGNSIYQTINSSYF